MLPDTCLAFITKYIAIARIMESSVCNPFLLLGCLVAKANAIDKWRPYSLCCEKTMKNGSSYVSRPPYATMRQLFDYRGQPNSQGSLLPEPKNKVVLEGGWDTSKENFANSSCVRVRVLFLSLNSKNKKKSDGR